MSRMKSVAVVALTCGLVLASVLAGAPRAAAAPFLNIYQGFYGTDYVRPTFIDVENCTDRSIFSGATYKIADAKGKVVESGAVKDGFLEDGTLVGRSVQTDIGPGFFTVVVNCLLYDGTSQTSVTAPFVVGLEYLKYTSGDPAKGGPVTLWSVGMFDPGEQVQLQLVDESGPQPQANGSATVVKTWKTTATVGEHSEWTFTADFPTPDPRREYTVRATGLSSGVVVGNYILATEVPAPKLVVTPGTLGSDFFVPTFIDIENCGDTSVYSGATYQITDAAGTVVDKGNAKEQKSGTEGGPVDRTIEKVLDPGVYKVDVTCVLSEYANQAPPTLSASATFVVSSETLEVRSGDPEKGGPVTLWSIGRLQQGEQVKLVLTDISPSLTNTGKDIVLKTWETTAVVGPNGEWTFTADIPVTSANRAYKLQATGLKSGKQPWTIFGNYLDLVTGKGGGTGTDGTGSGGVPHTGN